MNRYELQRDKLLLDTCNWYALAFLIYLTIINLQISMMKKLLLFIFSHSTLDMFSKISDLVGPMSCKLSKQDFKLSNPEKANLTSLALFNNYNELCSSEKKPKKLSHFCPSIIFGIFCSF